MFSFIKNIPTLRSGVLLIIKRYFINKVFKGAEILSSVDFLFWYGDKSFLQLKGKTVNL
jgi:hypothetical protein